MNTFEAVIQNTYSLQSLHKRVNFLKNFFNHKLFSDNKSAKAESLFSGEDLEWLKSLGPEFEQSFNSKNFDEILEDISQQAKNLTVLVIYFAIDLPVEKIDEIGALIRQDFNKNIIIDVKIDPTLLAGCALVYKGVYKDYSVRQQIEQNRANILTEFKTFLR